MNFLYLIAAAAVLNAFMDIVENENFSSSIFRNLNPKFWYKRESWKYAKKVLGTKLDAWHIAKGAMLFCIGFSMGRTWLESFLMAVVWWVCFEGSYFLFKSKKK